MLPSASKRAIHGNGRECLALREQIASRGGDSFLVRMHTKDVVLLMEDAPEGTWFFGMRRLYGKVVPGRCVRLARKPGTPKTLDCHPKPCYYRLKIKEDKMNDRFSLHNSMSMSSAMASSHGYVPLGSG